MNGATCILHRANSISNTLPHASKTRQLFCKIRRSTKISLSFLVRRPNQVRGDEREQDKATNCSKPEKTAVKFLRLH